MTIDADYIRKFVSDAYVRPARERGDSTLSIAVKSVESNLKRIGLQRGRTPAVCSALSGSKFQEENGIFLDRWDGPPSGQSPTVVFHFRFTNAARKSKSSKSIETPEERAFRLSEKLRGLMKDEIAAHGGAEGYLRWVRSEDEEAS